ncbi:MAG: hypothetical protein JWO82_2409 [Akkermansiaceae bacterium]|nr:hypothetical protein [Akkermansiaceae bacterium]
MTIPEPSKRPFGFPLPQEALDYFCDPISPDYGRPFDLDGVTFAVSPHFVLRCHHGHFTAFPAASEKQAAFVRTMPWNYFTTGTPEFRSLDNSRGGIYRGDPQPIWHQLAAGRRLNFETPVRVGPRPVIPIALLQLLARLPRPEVLLALNPTLFLRFNGGEVIVPKVWASHVLPTPAFSILQSTQKGAFEF